MNQIGLLPIILISLFLGLFSAGAQILKPAEWNIKLNKNTVNIGDTVEVVFDVRIDGDWYLYSNNFDPELGPIVTEITIAENNAYMPVGKALAINPKKKYDELWEGEYTYFKRKGKFIQKVVIKEVTSSINGNYLYQVCSDITGQCINFDEEFSLPVTIAKKKAALESDSETLPKTSKDAGNPQSEKIENPDIVSVDTVKDLFRNDKDKVFPDEQNHSESLETQSFSASDDTQPESLIGFFFFALIAGLAALLTPCVFPMIPLTVTFFTSNNTNRMQGITKAVVYGLSIILIYTLSGTLVAVLVGPEFANWLATHWVPNVLFFLIFIFFALSFLGLFEITLPSWLVNKTDQQADKGGYYGVFFMAFTLVLVSFSCTGPLVGSILVESSRGEFLKPIVGMLGFSVAFAIPFTLFATFPEALKSLPKSGGWLNSVKVVLGFLELALSLKFLSIADQVYHWGLLDRGLFLAIWVVIFGLLGLYLLGKLRMPGDSPIEKLPVLRLMLAIVVLSFTFYMIPGLFGAPLKALSGYLPPITTQDFNLTSYNVSIAPEEQAVCSDSPRFGDKLEIPHGIKGYFDYQEALSCARELDKPLFIDFTGHGCVNCREMEARVWSDPEVLERLKRDYVVVALYIDEKTTLPESEWYISPYDNKLKKTIGKQNADYQITRYNNNAQPYYLLLDQNEELLQKPKGYDLNISNFVMFLDKGKKEYQNRLKK